MQHNHFHLSFKKEIFHLLKADRQREIAPNLELIEAQGSKIRRPIQVQTGNEQKGSLRQIHSQRSTLANNNQINQFL